jgi:glycosyltransferase involved in cell wall biosynthesis
MRILFLTDWFDAPNRALVEYVAALPDVNAAAMCNFNCAHPRPNGVTRIDDFRCRSKFDFTAIRTLKERIAEGQFDVVHATNSRMLSISLAATQRLARPPQITGFMGHVGKFSRWNAIHRMTYLNPRVAGVWCNCHAVAEPLKRAGVAQDKLFVIHAGHPFQPRPAAPNVDLRSKLGIPSSAIVVGFVGNMRPVKGVDVLLNSALKLHDAETIHWMLLGKIEDKQVAELVNHPAIRDRVHSLGWRDDAQALLAAMDVFAMPSRSEGFSRAISEAMEAGLCVVATNVGGTPELIRHEIDGLTVPPEDPTALAEAIRRVAANRQLRTSLAAAGTERLRTEFTVDQMGRKIMAMFRAVSPTHEAWRRRAA